MGALQQRIVDEQIEYIIVSGVHGLHDSVCMNIGLAIL